MSLADIGNKSGDIVQRSIALQGDFEALLSACPPGATKDGLIALKVAMTMLKKECEKLANLTGTARMIGEVPQANARPVEEVPYTPPTRGQLTRSPEELRLMFPHHLNGPDRRMLAAGDHSLDDETT